MSQREIHTGWLLGALVLLVAIYYACPVLAWRAAIPLIMRDRVAWLGHGLLLPWAAAQRVVPHYTRYTNTQLEWSFRLMPPADGNFSIAE